MREELSRRKAEAKVGGKRVKYPTVSCLDQVNEVKPASRP